jgi:hypothetical protein
MAAQAVIADTARRHSKFVYEALAYGKAVIDTL